MSRGIATWTRRQVVRALAAGATVPPVVVRRQGHSTALVASDDRRHGRPVGPISALDPIVIIDGSDVRALTHRALDAARAAGADYADVRLTRLLRQVLRSDYVARPLQRLSAPYVRLDGEHERLGVGVRVRIGGAWGFASSPYWDAEDVVALAREAAAEAKANAKGSGPARAWVPIPVASGHWATPGVTDPFAVTLEEKADVLGAWMDAACGYHRSVFGADAAADFAREERALATSEGAYCTQTLYTAEGSFGVDRTTLRLPQRTGDAKAKGLSQTTAGWELFTNADIPGQLPRLFEEADPLRPGGPAVGWKPGEIGRYDVVFDAQSMGKLLEWTLGPATQLDRALGFEANAGGTSYLGPDPLALLGSFQATSPLVTVTANRSMSRGMATVKWDDEGVEPQDYALVKDGILVDYQTTRDSAPVLAPYYQRAGKSFGSRGNAGADAALHVTQQQMPNLVLEPGQEDVGFEALVADTKKGLAVTGAWVRTDFQGRTGWGQGTGREIINGKLGSAVTGLVFTFNTTNLWKNIMSLGGAESTVQYPTRATKGQPAQGTPYSVRAVPAAVTGVDFVTPDRTG